jgi:hypothetical protein
MKECLGADHVRSLAASYPKHRGSRGVLCTFRRIRQTPRHKKPTKERRLYTHLDFAKPFASLAFPPIYPYQNVLMAIHQVLNFFLSAVDAYLRKG